uniref:Uncharacterized protein n=1 Tax=Tetraselmis sp. GSL018 TaxID=582737 RepID=A0A061RCG3_9CHLO
MAPGEGDHGDRISGCLPPAVVDLHGAVLQGGGRPGLQGDPNHTQVHPEEVKAAQPKGAACFHQRQGHTQWAAPLHAGNESQQQRTPGATRQGGIDGAATSQRHDTLEEKLAGAEPQVAAAR